MVFREHFSSTNKCERLLFPAKRKFKKLTQENTLLQQQLLQLRQPQQEPVEKLNFQVLQARVIKASFNQARNMLVLNKGAKTVLLLKWVL